MAQWYNVPKEQKRQLSSGSLLTPEYDATLQPVYMCNC